MLLLALGGCGGSERQAYVCPVDLRPGFVGAGQELPCAQVTRNVALARAIMSQAAPEFGDRLIKSVDIRSVESWDCGGFECWGLTTFNGSEARVELGRSMWSLVHELGHVYLKYTTGDSDHAHSRWDSSGQRARDMRYQESFEPLAPAGSP